MDVGLGSMGFPMASNLRKKISKDSILYVNDVDTAAMDRFIKENSSYGPIKALTSAKEIADHAVFEQAWLKLISEHYFLHRSKRGSCEKCVSGRENGNHRRETRVGK